MIESVREAPAGLLVGAYDGGDLVLEAGEGPFLAPGKPAAP